VNPGKLLQASAFLLFLAALVSTAGARVVDGIVAVVNDEPITFSEFRESIAETLRIPEGDADIYLRGEKDRRRILSGLEMLIDSVLVRQELKKLDMSITDKDVERSVESVWRTNNMSEAEFRAALATEGISQEAYRRRIRWQMERGAVVRATKMKEITVTEEETKAYFQENAERFLVGADVLLETLFLPFPPELPGTDRGVRIRIAAQQASEIVRSGATFTEAAGLLSSVVPDVSAFSSGFVKTEDLLPEIGREVRRLRTGENSPPIFTEEGAYLVKVLERRGGTLPEFSAVRTMLTDELFDRRSEKAFSDLLVDLKKAATIDIRL